MEKDYKIARIEKLPKAKKEEWEECIRSIKQDQKNALLFLLRNCRAADYFLSKDVLLNNLQLAYQAREEFKWCAMLDEEIFFEYVLPYAQIDEVRDNCRVELYVLCSSIIGECKTPTEVAMKINTEIFKLLPVCYSTERKKPNQNVTESRESGKASCTGLSVILANCLRAVGYLHCCFFSFFSTYRSILSSLSK
jgi:hypothetical protein